MVKVKNSRVNSVAAKRMQPGQVQGLGFNVNIIDVKTDKELIQNIISETKHKSI